MGYVNTFANQMVSDKNKRSSVGLFANPVAIASVLAVSALATFLAVKCIVGSSYFGGVPYASAAAVSTADITLNSATPLTTTATTTTTSAPTTTTTTTVTTITAVHEAEGRFKRAILLYPTSYRTVNIPGLTLPAEFDNGLLDPEAVFWLINEYRVQNGLQPFSRAGSELGKAAEIRAGELFDLFSQTRPDGTAYTTAFDQCGVKYEYTMESVGYGQYTAGQIVNDWINSSENLSNILNSTCNSVYIVCVVGSDNIPVWVLEGIC